MDTLSKLFGSTALVRVMRLFLFHQQEALDIKDVIDQTRVSKESARWAVNLLLRIGMLKKKAFTKEVEVGRKGNKQLKRKKVHGWAVVQDFPYLNSLRGLIIDAYLLSERDLAKRFSRIKNVQLLIASGIFVQNEEGRVDLFIVADKMNKNTLENAIKAVEAEIGTEIRYTALNTDEFKYRSFMYDRMIRDILDYPHKKVIDKIGV